jgi:hypothetical protein
VPWLGRARAPPRPAAPRGKLSSGGACPAEARWKIAAEAGVLDGLAAALWVQGHDKCHEDAAAALSNLAVSDEARLTVARTPGVVSGLTGLVVSGSDKVAQPLHHPRRPAAAGADGRARARAGPVPCRHGPCGWLRRRGRKARSDAAAALGNLAVHVEARGAILAAPGLGAGLAAMIMAGDDKQAGEAACCLQARLARLRARASGVSRGWTLAVCAQNLAVTTVARKVTLASEHGLILALVMRLMSCAAGSACQDDCTAALLNLVVGASENKAEWAPWPWSWENGHFVGSS